MIYFSGNPDHWKWRDTDNAWTQGRWLRKR